MNELGFCDDYAPGTVAWNDGDRGVIPNGDVSVFGTNNTDSKLKAKDNRTIPYLKSKNYNEKLGVSTADNIIMGKDSNGKPVTAQDVLEGIDERAKYMNYPSIDIKSKVQPKQPVVVRFQHAFVPMGAEEESVEVVPTNYSFQTLSKDQPRNLLVSGCNDGIFVQSDDTGENPLFAHRQSESGTTKHWFTIKSSNHDVGQPQVSTDTTNAHGVGIKGMGPRSNAFVIMSIPNKLKSTTMGGLGGYDYYDMGGGPVYRSLSSECGEAKAAILGVSEESAGTVSNQTASIVWDGKEPIVITILYYNTPRQPRANLSTKWESLRKISHVPFSTWTMPTTCVLPRDTSPIFPVCSRR